MSKYKKSTGIQFSAKALVQSSGRNGERERDLAELGKRAPEEKALKKWTLSTSPLHPAKASLGPGSSQGPADVPTETPKELHPAFPGGHPARMPLGLWRHCPAFSPANALDTQLHSAEEDSMRVSALISINRC